MVGMQAPQYTRTTGFADDERVNTGGRTTVRADRLDAELDGVSTSVNALQTNLELIQRDDGALRDGIVRPNSLSAGTLALLVGGSFTARGDWTTGVLYRVDDLVEGSGASYVCLVQHTSGVFATDRAANYWQVLFGQVIASNVIFTPAGTIAATTVQAAVEEVAADASLLSIASLAFNYGAY